MDGNYSASNAEKFGWSSVTGNLNDERVSHLEKYLVGKKILDAGCGGGAYVEFLCKKGLEVTGVDKYEEFLSIGQRKGYLGKYVQSDIESLPFEDKSFDCTYCFDVLEHINDKKAIQELARVTKERLIIAVPKEDEEMNKFRLTFLHYQDKTHLRNYTEASLKELISSIKVSKVVVFPELMVPIKGLMREMVECKLKEIVNTEMRWRGMKALGRKILKLNKGKREDNVQKWEKTIEQFLIAVLIERAEFKEVYTSLVAIVDL